MFSAVPRGCSAHINLVQVSSYWWATVAIHLSVQSTRSLAAVDSGQLDLPSPNTDLFIYLFLQTLKRFFNLRLFKDTETLIRNDCRMKSLQQKLIFDKTKTSNEPINQNMQLKSQILKTIITWHMQIHLTIFEWRVKTSPPVQYKSVF